jgi:hypothetical protein
VVEAEKLYVEGYRFEVMRVLDTAFENEQNLSKRDLAKAYYFRGKARVGLFDLSAEFDGKAYLQYLESPLLDAAKDYEAALSFDAGPMKARIESAQGELAGYLLFFADLDFSNTFNVRLQPSETNDLLKRSLARLNALEKIAPEEYELYALRASVASALGESSEAHKDCELALEKYSAVDSEWPNQSIGNLYYRKALLESSALDDSKLALQSIAQGREVVETEHEKYLEMRWELEEELWIDIEEEYTDVLAQLDELEAEIEGS